MSTPTTPTQTEDPTQQRPISAVPDKNGWYGDCGGVFVPETLVEALNQLSEVYEKACQDKQFWDRLNDLNRLYVGRPTPLYRAGGLTRRSRAMVADKEQGATIWLKREDLAHTGAHKINNTLGQALLAKKMGKKRIIAETGAGQHGVATATACAHLGLKCEIYMGSEDIRRQHLNVVRMKILGAKVNAVDDGSRTLKDATNAALRDWMGSVSNTHYILGSVVGPHPFPMIVRDFQSIIGREAKAQCLRYLGGMPKAIVACVGGGSNAAGMFYPFVDEQGVEMIGVEAGGRSDEPGEHAAPISHGKLGVLHGSMSYVLQDPNGQTSDVHSCSAGLDYPGVGPEHSYWNNIGRVSYTSVSDKQALDAFVWCSRDEGIIPALESSHAVAFGVAHASTMNKDEHLVINLSGRGDKDVEEASRLLGDQI